MVALGKPSLPEQMLELNLVSLAGRPTRRCISRVPVGTERGLALQRPVWSHRASSAPGLPALLDAGASPIIRNRRGRRNPCTEPDGSSPAATPLHAEARLDQDAGAMEARISGDTGRQSGALRWRRKSHRTGPRENADGTRCRRRAGRAGAAALLLVPVLAPAQHPAPLDDAAVSRQIVTVRVYKDDRLAAQGAGVVVSGEGDVLTSAAVLDAGPRVAVVAQGSGELGAAERLKEKGSGLGVLRVDGLQRAGLPVSTAPLAPGARIFAVTPGTTPGQAVAFSAGAVGEVAVESIRGGEEARFVQHNAMIAARGYGSPSLDECGRIVALNVPDPGAFTIFTVPRKIQPEGLVFALAAGEIAPRLTELGIAFTRVTEACASAEARAQSQAQEAERAQVPCIGDRTRNHRHQTARAVSTLREYVRNAMTSRIGLDRGLLGERNRHSPTMGAITLKYH